jgi:O-methyltransferase
VDEAAKVLLAHGRVFAAAPGDANSLWTIGEDNDDLHRAVQAGLTREGISFRSTTADGLEALSNDDVGAASGILCCYRGNAALVRLARVVAARPALAAVPLEYAGGLDPKQAVFARLDEYPDTWFVSPVLLDDPSPYDIYEESLVHFEQKCGLRDYLDLYQLLKSVVERSVPGDVAEFGSYRGHSGYLIARTLDALGSDKALYMFDTFDSFPDEPLGVDHFWSRTHDVNFDEVRRKLESIGRVRLVKGDFTQTLASSGLGQVALAYVDCDSYRATRFLFETLLPEQVSVGGVFVCEDYGHPALLGNRAAVHDSLSSKSPWLRLFSQFSGLYIVVKLDQTREVNSFDGSQD